MGEKFSAVLALLGLLAVATLLRHRGARWAMPVALVLIGAGAVAVGVPGVKAVATFLADAPMNVEGWFE